MRILRWLFLASLTSLAAAQFTTVTGTVTDPNSIPYANGTITAALVTSATPIFSATNLPYTPPTQPVGLNSAGSFVMRLADVTALTPGGSTWTFTVCSGPGTVQPAGGAGPVCFTVPALVIAGASQSITVQLHAAAVALTILPASGTVTNIATTAPITGGPITTTGTIACATCAIGPGSSVAGNIPAFTNTDGVTLADSGLRVSPIFSTPVTGTSMVTAGVNTVLVGPVSMVTPGANGTYRFIVQLIQTTPGSGGACAAGTVQAQLAYKDADTGVTFALTANQTHIQFTGMSIATSTGPVQMTSTGNGNANIWTSTPREFRAASGVAIQYQFTEGTNSNCTTPPVFAVRPALYYMGY